MARGVHAALPAEGHRRPSVLDDAGPVVTHISEKGDQRAIFDFGALPVSAALQRSLAAAFASRIYPPGEWRSTVSSTEVWLLVRTFTRWLAQLDPPPQSIADITPAVWNQWRVSRPQKPLGQRQIRKIAALLKRDDRLPEATREAVLRRVAYSGATESAYSPEEFEEIRQAAAGHFRRAWQRIAENRAHLDAWRSGAFDDGSREWVLGEALDHLARTGDVPVDVGADGHRRVVASYLDALGGISSEWTWRRLFLDRVEMVSLVTLIVSAHGWNLTAVSEMVVPQVLSASAPGEPIVYRAELEKRRRNATHRYETRNLTDWGPNSPGRLFTRAIEATAPARDLLRAHGAATDLLLVWHVHLPLLVADRAALLRTGIGTGNGVGDPAFRRWSQVTGAGELNLRRLRRTVTVLHRRTPTQHSRDVHDSVYVLRDPATHRGAEAVIAEGIADAVDHAKAVVAARVTDDSCAGDRGTDTATANCGDYTHSPFSPHGSPCRASFLLCLACANAVVTPRHLPRLAYLHQALESLRTVLPARTWAHDWREHHSRLTQLKDSSFTAAEWADALTAVNSSDRATIELLLRKGFDS
ncbi:hypothetical protein [Nocardia puris]|uniref:Uncharacterized protein n=1 Tax=Nocardia puris TaxID=208602 RepID=A0A366D5M3_9NOCA|nr:hypothetical protein [Nocardia puris]RBO85343.1 hypothetical protein DFR74_115191 [Nocardia puris]